MGEEEQLFKERLSQFVIRFIIYFTSSGNFLGRFLGDYYEKKLQGINERNSDVQTVSTALFQTVAER